MGIILRISKNIKANLHELIDHFENPKALLNYSIKEMEATLYEVSIKTTKSVANRKILEQKLERAKNDLKQFQDNAENAVKSNKDEIAKEFLRKSNIALERVGILETELIEAAKLAEHMKAHLTSSKDSLEHAKEKRVNLLTRHHLAEMRAESKKLRRQCRGACKKSMYKSENVFTSTTMKDFEEKLERKLAEIDAEDEIDNLSFDTINAETTTEDLEVEEQLLALKEKLNH
ncbi:MAG: hypothetical protein COA79_05915 [Planctomycetota bacterium]|nr:MAG: hypothetical protein COA79_05915 [Planctomycetota bacterium]